MLPTPPLDQQISSKREHGSSSTMQSCRAHRSSTTHGATQARPFGNARPRAQLCRATQQLQLVSDNSRRDVLLQLGSLTAGSVLSGLAGPQLPAGAAAPPQVPEVGKYLPPAGIDDLVLFVPDARKTPALRAGTVDPNSPYKFALPPSFREGKVANILSGNYCQPRCDEPWTEVLFESGAEGKIIVIVSPLIKLTRVKGAAIDDIGSPEGILNSLGSYITGTTLDVEGGEEVLSATSKRQEDGRMYYYYEIDSPYATNGPHSVSAATTKGDLALVFIAAANDKQWARSKDKLVKAAQSFRA